MYNNFYNSGMYNPQNYPVNQFNGINQPQNQQLIRVNGIDGAKAYSMGANGVVALFDANDDYFYLKQTDGAGFGSIRTFRFEEITNFSKNSENPIDLTQFITRKDMEEYGEQLIQKFSGNTRNQSDIKSNAKSEPRTNQ